ncbi:MAG: hypothetical protein ABID54_06245 [Pseudomonadota bacterium]
MQEKKYEGNPYVALDKGEMPGIEMPHEIAVHAENKGRHKASCRGGREKTHKKIHKDTPQQAVQNRRIYIGQIRLNNIIEET